MDDYYSDSFYDGDSDSQTPNWSEKQWHDYLRKSELEVRRFAAAYAVNKLRGMELPEIAKISGWAIPENDDSIYYEDDEPFAEFSEEPWTIFNHPVYIITRALFRCLREYTGKLLQETGVSADFAWNLAAAINEAASYMSGGVNCIDMGEDLLARCNYKTALFHLNNILAKLSDIPQPKSEQGRERLRRANAVIFDLRQLSLDLSKKSTKKKM